MRNLEELTVEIARDGLSAARLHALRTLAETSEEAAWLLVAYVEDSGPWEDLPLAEALYRKLATTPFFKARLADFLAEHVSTKERHEEVVRLYSEVAPEDGLAAWNFSVFLRLGGERIKSLYWLERAAELGSTEAQVRLLEIVAGTRGHSGRRRAYAALRRLALFGSGSSQEEAADAFCHLRNVGRRRWEAR